MKQLRLLMRIQMLKSKTQSRNLEKGATVIIVAHRLDTVLDSDKIVVMGYGEVIEYGKPSDLLKINNGQLRTMVDADLHNKKKGASTNRNSSTELQEPLLA